MFLLSGRLYKHLSELIGGLFFVGFFLDVSPITGLKRGGSGTGPDNSTLLVELGKAHFAAKHYEDAEEGTETSDQFRQARMWKPINGSC